MNRRTFLKSSAGLAAVAGWAELPPRVAAAANADVRRGLLFDVRDFGAALDGRTDDTPAMQRAWAAMQRDGKAFGTLLVTGVARLGARLDLDGGYRNTTHESQWAAGQGEDLRILVLGSLRPDAGVGTAVLLHGARCVFADFRFDRGGNENDVALKCEDLDLADIGVRATNFAGTVLYADASADKTKRIRSSKIRHVFASQCGRGIYWRGIEAFGSFEMVWDRDCRQGSHFRECADIGIQHYENFSPASHTIGLHFEECNSFNVGVITVGDRATEALVQITGGDFGSIQRLRASGRPDREAATPTAGLRLKNVKSLNIDNLHTFRCQTGLHVIGSNVKIQRHYSMTGDVNPLVIEGTDQIPAPRVEIGAWYRYHRRESVRILPNVQGGTLRLHGTIYDMNVDGAADIWAVDCRSPAMILDVAGLTQEARRVLAGSIFHPQPDHIRGVARARLGNPLVHGQITTEPVGLGEAIQNADERTLNLSLSIRYEPTPGEAATCRCHWGANREQLVLAASARRAAGSDSATDPVTLRVPPWWWYQIEVQHASIAGSSGYRE